MYYLRLILLCSCACMSLTPMRAQSDFIRVVKGQFRLGNQPYTFLGTNFWYGINLGAADESGDRERLLRELDALAELGITNLRIMAGSEGPDTEPWRMLPSLQPAPGVYNEALWEGLDFLLAEMGKRGLYAVVCLNNFWPWSGGMAQYVAWAENKSIPYPPPAAKGDWVKYQFFASRFYKVPAAQAAFEAHIAQVVSRVNTLTGTPYREDPTIMAWQLANEPRGSFNGKAFRRWADRTAAYIKSLDPNHLVSLGSEGATFTKFAGNRFKKDHRSKYIDYTTIHIWIQNWQWYDPQRPEQSYPEALAKASRYLKKHLKKARSLGKPMVLEEFGIARDEDDHNPAATTHYRDRYYAAMFELVHQRAAKGSPLMGCNFWAWGGEGRPSEPHSIWRLGDDFIGDPPHEYQGWYSVYDTDHSTRELIKTYASKMNALRK